MCGSCPAVADVSGGSVKFLPTTSARGRCKAPHCALDGLCFPKTPREKGRIEGGVVDDDSLTGNDLSDSRHQLGERRLAADHLVGNAMYICSSPGYWSARVHQGVEHRAARRINNRHLDNCITCCRAETCSLGVKE